MGPTRDDPVHDALERLYAAPLDAFMALRRELVASLRAAGGRDAAQAAREVAAAPKPTRTAWALNDVARRQPELVRGMLEARDAAAAAQKGGEGEAIRAAVREYRSRLAEMTHAVRDVLAGAGFGATTPQLRRVNETLTTASVEGSPARERLVAGRLTEDVGVDDPFGGMEMEAAPGRVRHPVAHARHEAREAAEVGNADAAARESAARERAKKEEEQEAARERAKHEAARKAAQQRVDALESAASEARSEARRLEKAAVRARDEADRAAHAADEAESRLEKARAELRAMPT
jgi:hypothetical protein